MPGDATHPGLISAKAFGYDSVSVFAYPGSANVDITLSDRTVRRFELSAPDPVSITCDQQSVITAHV